jgi:spore maturation protein CgeB
VESAAAGGGLGSGADNRAAVMSPPRILVANFRWFGGFGAALSGALRAEGALVDDVICRNYEGLELRRLVENAAGRGWPLVSPFLRAQLARDFAVRQEALVRRARATRPHIFLVVDEDQVTGETLDRVQDACGAPRALWIADDPWSKEHLPAALASYDVLFVFDRHYVDAIRAATRAEVHYLPLAGDDTVFHPPAQPLPQAERRGAVHIGSRYPERERLLAAAAPVLPDLEIHGWARRDLPAALAPAVCGGRIPRRRANEIYGRAWVVLSLHHHQVRRAPTRVFDPALAGAFQITEARPDLAALLEPDREIVTFASDDELRAKLAHYRARPAERERIAAAGRARVLAEHTFRHRARAILELAHVR